MSSGSRDETIVMIGPHDHALPDAMHGFDKTPGSLRGLSVHVAAQALLRREGARTAKAGTGED